MKELLLLMTLLMMSFISISQDLVPKVQLIENEKHYCFTIAQSREIAKLLELGKYNDSLVHNLSLNIKRFELVTQKKDSIISFQADQLENYTMVINNNDRTILLLEDSIKRKEKKIKKSKLHKILLGISLVALGTLVISK
ncbi:hypothetical protein [uncultured Aquimarina sp.]|uniref:hypothetical protein n=1 Tax=uncultured Aquimarina sp. TaxID=575652 RepID=UPI0026397138|nr:hypothetical protein [uncultured Aquimarina sp.]